MMLGTSAAQPFRAEEMLSIGAAIGRRWFFGFQCDNPRSDLQHYANAA